MSDKNVASLFLTNWFNVPLEPYTQWSSGTQRNKL